MLPAIDLLGIRRSDQRFNFQVYSWKSDEIGFFIITGWVNLTQWIYAILDERIKIQRTFVTFVVQGNIFLKIASVLPRFCRDNVLIEKFRGNGKVKGKRSKRSKRKKKKKEEK